MNFSHRALTLVLANARKRKLFSGPETVSIDRVDVHNIFIHTRTRDRQSKYTEGRIRTESTRIRIKVFLTNWEGRLTRNSKTK